VKNITFRQLFRHISGNESPETVGSNQEMNGEKLLSTTGRFAEKFLLIIVSFAIKFLLVIESFAIKFLFIIESIIFVH
jgi:hypothetical protein